MWTSERKDVRRNQINLTHVPKSRRKGKEKRSRKSSWPEKEKRRNRRKELPTTADIGDRREGSKIWKTS